MDQPLMRVKEAAQLLQVGKWTIYRWIDEGRLDATKIRGGSLRIFLFSVSALVERNRTDPRANELAPRFTTVRSADAGPRNDRWARRVLKLCTLLQDLPSGARGAASPLTPALRGLYRRPAWSVIHEACWQGIDGVCGRN